STSKKIFAVVIITGVIFILFKYKYIIKNLILSYINNEYALNNTNKINNENDIDKKMNDSIKNKVINNSDIVGLRNLGNTCFMNTTIQCLAHSSQLTKYFLKGYYKQNINHNNPLGLNGIIV